MPVRAVSGVQQMVAELAHNQNVEGSSPSPATMVDSWKFGAKVTFAKGGSVERWFPTKKTRDNWVSDQKFKYEVRHVEEKKR